MSNENILQELRNNNLIEMSVGFDEWIEGYRGLRRNVFSFVDTQEEFNNDKNTCIVITRNGEIDEEGLKIAYKHYLLQKMSLPYIV